MAWSKWPSAASVRPSRTQLEGDAELEPGPLLVVGRRHLVCPHVVGVAEGQLVVGHPPAQGFEVRAQSMPWKSTNWSSLNATSLGRTTWSSSSIHTTVGTLTRL